MKVTRKSARALQALVFLVAIALVATAIPAVLYGNLPVAEAAEVSAGSEQQLKDAFNNPDATKITLTGNIALTGFGAAYHNAPRFTVPTGRTVELNLNGYSITWNEIHSDVGTGSARGMLAYGNNATSNTGGYKYIMIDNQGTLNITGSGTLGMDFQATQVENDENGSYNTSKYMHYAGVLTVIRNSGTLTVGSNVNITANLVYEVDDEGGSGLMWSGATAGDIYVTVNGIYQTAGEVTASGNIKVSVRTVPIYVKLNGFRSPAAGFSFAYGIYGAGGVINYTAAANKTVDVDVYTCIRNSGGNVTAYKNSCLQLSAVGFYTNNPASQFIGANIDCHIDYGDDYNQNQGDNILSSSKNNVSAIGVQYAGEPPVIGSGTNINTSTSALPSMEADGNISKTKKPVNQSSEPPMNFMEISQDDMPGYWGVDSDDPAPDMQEDQGHTTTNNSYKDEAGNLWTPDDGESTLNGGIPSGQLNSVNKVMIVYRYFDTTGTLADYEITNAETDKSGAVSLSNVANGRGTVGQPIGYTGGGEVKNSNFYELRAISATPTNSGAVATNWYAQGNNGMNTLARYDKATNTITPELTVSATGGMTTLIYADYYAKVADSIRFNLNNTSITDDPVTTVSVEYTGKALKFGEDLFLHVYKCNSSDDDPTATQPFGNDVEITNRFSNISSGSTVATYRVIDQATGNVIDNNNLPTNPGTYTVKVTAAGETTYNADPRVSMNFGGATFDFTLIIRPRNVNITQTATPQLTYGQKLSDLSSAKLAEYFTIDTGIVGLPADGTFEWVTPDVIPPVGTQTYQLRWTSTNGYFETQVLDSVTVEVLGANLTVALNPKTVTYGDPLELTLADVTFGTAIVPGEEETIFNAIKNTVVVNNIAYEPGAVDAGQHTYTLTATNAGNYTLQVMVGNLTVAQRALTITIPPVTKTYDGTALVDIAFDSTCVVDGLIDPYGANGVTLDPYEGASLANNGAVGSTTASIIPAQITLSGTKHMNYRVGTVTNQNSISVTVVPAAPQVAPLILKNNTITYDPTKKLSTFEELNDTAAAIKVVAAGEFLPDGVTPATPGQWTWKEDVKPTVKQTSYIAVFTPDDPNYAPVEQEIPIAVLPREITVGVTMAEIFYGDDQPAASYTFDGFPTGSPERINYVSGQLSAVGFTLSGNASYACAYNPDDPNNKDAGDYPITVTSTLTADNYTFIPSADSKLTVKPKDLIITPNPVSVTYGTTLTNDRFSLNITGWVSGDEALAAQLSPVYTHDASGKAGVGSYPLTVSFQNGDDFTNYNFVINEGQITVTKAVLTVTADSISVPYGTEPNYTYKITGYQYGDNETVIAGAPTFSSSYSTSSPAGETFPIVVNTAGMSADNYAFRAGENATLTVTSSTVRIQTPPTFEVESGKTLADAVIATPGKAIDVAGNEVEGVFRIDNRDLVLEYRNNDTAANNVSITFYPTNTNYASVAGSAKVEVKARPISGQPSISGPMMVGGTLTIDLSTMDPSVMDYYDASSITWNIGDRTVTDTRWITLTEADRGKYVSVTITAKDGSGYTGTATFRSTTPVDQAAEVPTVENLIIPEETVTVTYDRLSHGFTVLAGNSYLGDITVLYNGSSAAPTSAGTYVVTVNIGSSASGTFAPVSGLKVGTLVIEPRPIQVVFTAADKTYDGKVTATVSNIDATRGVISGDQVTVNTSAASFEFVSPDAGYQSVVMKYAYLEGAARDNYVIAQEEVYANINPKEITAAAYAADQEYDEDNYTVYSITFGSPVGLIAGDRITLNPTTGRVGNNAAGAQDVIYIEYNGVMTGRDSGNYTFLASNDGALRVNILRVPEPGMEYPDAIQTTYSSIQRLEDLSGELPVGWSWVDPTIIPTVRQKTYQAVYTPSNPSYESATYDVVINVVPVEVTIIPDSLSIEYGSPVPNLTYTTEGFTGDDDPGDCSGSIVITTNYNQGDDVGTYNIRVDASTINNPNYTFVKNVTGTIEVTPREIVVTPSAEDVAYDPDNTSVTVKFSYTGFYENDDVSLSEEETIGTLANNNAGSQLVTYTPPTLIGADKDNYTLRISGATIRINVKKADPVVTWPTSAVVEYGQRFSTAVFEGGEGEGSFMFVDASRVASDLNGGYYEVRFTPTDSNNYNSLTQQVLLRVSHAELNMSVSISGTLYEGQTLTAAVSGVPQDALQYLHYAWYRVAEDGTAVLVSDASTYELGANDIGYYIRLEVSADPTAPYSGEATFTTVRPVEEEQLTFWEKLVRWFYSILAAIQSIFDAMFSIGM